MENTGRYSHTWEVFLLLPLSESSPIHHKEKGVSGIQFFTDALLFIKGKQGDLDFLALMRLILHTWFGRYWIKLF